MFLNLNFEMYFLFRFGDGKKDAALAQSCVLQNNCLKAQFSVLQKNNKIKILELI